MLALGISMGKIDELLATAGSIAPEKNHIKITKN